MLFIADEPRVEGKEERNEGEDVWQRSREIEGKVELSERENGEPKGDWLAKFQPHSHAEESEDVDDAKTKRSADETLDGERGWEHERGYVLDNHPHLHD